MDKGQNPSNSECYTPSSEPFRMYKCNNGFSNKIKPLHVSANDAHHRKATNTSKEMLHMYYMHVVLYGLH
jgi:hypothetical protein